MWYFLMALPICFTTLLDTGCSSGRHVDPIEARIAIVGDSTVANYKTEDSMRGWGQLFPEFIDTTRVRVRNLAVNGRSTKTFKNEGLWDKALIAKPDYIFIQFGHNDAHEPDRPESTDAKTDYPDYLREFVSTARAQKSSPILVTPMHRGTWTKDGAHLTQELRPYAESMRQVATETSTPLIDLYQLSETAFETMGQAEMKTLFAFPASDLSHFNEKGARLLAGMIATETGHLVPELKSYLQEPVATTVAAVQQPTLYLIGDSTVRNGQGDGSNGQWGWGEPIADFFDSSKIKVVNRALGGRSSRTFIAQGLWDKVRDQLKPGDFVIMQFGHNDASPVNDDSRARGVLRGVGEETEEIDNLLTKQHEVVHTYGWYLRKMIAEAKAKGAIPIVCSPIPRDNFKEGKVNRVADSWGKWAAEVARSEKVPYINLNEIIGRKYDALGAEKVAGLFQGDHTHTNRAGAELNAACVIAGLKALKDVPLSAYLSPKAAEVTATEVELVEGNRP